MKLQTKMISLQTTSLILSILLFSCGLSEAGFLDYFRGIFDRKITIDRSENLAAQYLLPIDKTSFNVSQSVWLRQVDLAVVFAYDQSEEKFKEKELDNVPTNISILQGSNYPEEPTLLYSENIYLNSTQGAEITFANPILLKKGVEYEIRAEIPEENHLQFDDNLKLGAFTIRRFVARNIIVNFNKGNSGQKPDFDKDTTLLSSNGLVKRIHLKYHVFK